MNLHKSQCLYFIINTLLHSKMTTLDWSVIVIGSMGEATLIIIMIIILKFCLLMQEVKSPIFLSLFYGGGGDDTKG
jgi:hypothetical protein